jgi:hypothetical protein
MDQNIGYVAIGLFVLSELLAFTKKTKGNGVLHTLLCIIQGSECILKNVKEQVEKELDVEKGVKTADVAIQTE